MKLRFIAPVAATIALIAAPAMAATGTHHHKAKTEKPAKAPKAAKPAKAAKAPK